MHIGRRPDGTIYGLFGCAQPDDEFHPGMEEVPEDHPDVLDFIARSRASPEERVEAARLAALAGKE